MGVYQPGYLVVGEGHEPLLTVRPKWVCALGRRRTRDCTCPPRLPRSPGGGGMEDVVNARNALPPLVECVVNSLRKKKRRERGF